MSTYEITNHNSIYHWASARGLWPACVAGRPECIRFGGAATAVAGEELEPLEWRRWFGTFDKHQLRLVFDPAGRGFTLEARLAVTC